MAQYFFRPTLYSEIANKRKKQVYQICVNLRRDSGFKH